MHATLHTHADHVTCATRSATHFMARGSVWQHTAINHAPRGPKVNAGRGKAGGLLVWLGCDVAASTPATYQRHRL